MRQKSVKRKLLVFTATFMFLAGGCGNIADEKISDDSLPVPAISFQPKRYVCYYTNQPPVIDGKLHESVWQDAEETDLFVDIEGDQKPLPYHNTTVKMLWDSTYFYFGAVLEEPHVWAKLTERDAVIYHDNDFEIFIDPDGDTHEYYELEINAFKTEWDLFIVRPYRDGAPAINAWDIQGLKTGIHIEGTLNDPSDTDSLWSVEVAIPWDVMSQAAHKPSPPNEQDQWRVNFSRVQWETDIVDGRYIKRTDDAGKNLPEYNWVWSPQGLIAMHYPEMWGFVQFTTKTVGSQKVLFEYDQIEDDKWFLRQLYYAERTYHMQYGRYTEKLSDLSLPDDVSKKINRIHKIHASDNQFEIIMKNDDGRTVRIDHEGRTSVKVTED